MRREGWDNGQRPVCGGERLDHDHLPAADRPSLRPRFLPEIRPTQFNYPIDIHGKWHGNRYRFLQRYRSGYSHNKGEEFDSPFARLDWISRDRFNVQWPRHTGQWFCLYRAMSLAEALDALVSDGLLHPL